MAKVTIKRRLANLEKETLGAHLKPLRYVVRVVGKPLDLAASTCRRTIGQNGRLTEVVLLNGTSESFSEADLESFVAKFPIEKALSRYR